MFARFPPCREVKGRLAELDAALHPRVDDDLLADLAQQVDPGNTTIGTLLCDGLNVDRRRWVSWNDKTSMRVHYTVKCLRYKAA